MILWNSRTRDWLEGRGAALYLMGAVDDATGEPASIFAWSASARSHSRRGCTVGYRR